MALPFEGEPVVPERKPGELPSDYLERIGRTNGWLGGDGPPTAEPFQDPDHDALPSPYDPARVGWLPYREDHE